MNTGGGTSGRFSLTGLKSPVLLTGLDGSEDTCLTNDERASDPGIEGMSLM